MPLQIEHRPSELSEVFGNQAIKDSLQSIFDRKSDYPHAFLFHGPTGCGKTTLARIVAGLLHCDSPEELNMSNLRGIDAVRQIVEDCIYAPLTGTRRVYIFDEVHRQTKDAQNALLKPLEDPPPHVYFILCTTDPDLLIPALRGRCHPFQVKPLKSSEMMDLLKSILKRENIEEFPETILKKVILLSEGLARNALVLLDTVIDMPDEESAIAALSAVILGEATTKELCQAIMEGTSWEFTKEILKNILVDVEPEKIRQAVLGYLTNVLLGSKKNDRVAFLIDVFSNNIFYNARPGIVNMVYAATKGK
jgi:DNA polymerase III gamma/tau subunit